MALVFLLAFGSVSTGITSVSAAPNKKGEAKQEVQLKKPTVKIPETLKNPKDPKKEVRIIVELESEPAIENATRKGVLYKDLPKKQKETLEAAVSLEQDSVQSTITKLAPEITYLENFTTVFNGFSAQVEAGKVNEIASQIGVKAVYESTEYKRPEIKPEMKYSKELVQAQQVWTDYKYKGEGMVVGVIDTGIDPSHKDMVLSDDTSGEITKDEVGVLLNDGSIEGGQYFTPKVPFGYNYMDGNKEILDLGPEASMHGMHVAGTVGANGDEENGGIKGVAPEAQLLALKVFGNDPLYPSTYGDIYIKAIDDSIKLGADVINMSLGSVSGFVDSQNPEQQAVERATNSGILVSISAGNSDMLGSGYFYPYAENQDYGLTGSPSVSFDSFGVASFENDFITAMSFAYQADGADAGRAMYLLANDKDPRDLPAASYEVASAGFGTTTDFEGKDFTGKFALISRGSISFVEKGLNAQAAGAAGVIVYNNTTGTINMASDPAIQIPYMSALQADGVAMKTLIDAGKKVTIKFDGQYVETQSPTAGKMSDFTSWGPTPNLDFKPEITAPGGNIFSTLNNDEYGLMSGTSMAAPHVSGGTALIFQRINELGLTGKERVQFAKNLMMNTANPVQLTPGEFVSPRRQGAGLMQLHDALSTDVVATNKATGESKVALKEITDSKFTFTVTAQNFSDQAANYNVAVNVQTDKAITASGVQVTAPNIVGSNVVTDQVIIDVPESVTVPANGSKEITVAVDVSALETDAAHQAFTNGFFVDGFLTLTDANEEVTGNPELVIPYFGFNGGWDDANIFDYVAWNDSTYYGMTFLADEKGNTITGGTHQPNYVPERFAFSPNGDGIMDQVIPVYSLLRNAKEFEVKVLDASGKTLRTIHTDKELVKNYSADEAYNFDKENAWNGKVLEKAVADGDYQIQLSAVIDYENAQWQSITFPVKVDTVAPTAKASFNKSAKLVEVASFTDNPKGAGADRWEVFLNDKELTEDASTPEDESLAPEVKSYAVATELKEGDKLTAVFYDTAGNKKELDLLASTPETVKPVIYIESPDVLSVHKTKEVAVSGKVEDDSKIVSVTINGEPAKEFDGKNFSHSLTLADGSNYVKVKAIDEFGNEMEIRRQVLVDTKPAVITLVDVPKRVKADEDRVEITFNVKDNFDEIQAYFYDSQIFSQKLTAPYELKNFSKNITIMVPVPDEGENEIKLKVVDLAGHVTEKTFTITKKASKPDKPGKPDKPDKPNKK